MVNKDVYILTMTCGYILDVCLNKYSGSSRKMAHGQLLLNSVLCFLVNKFGKVDVNSLKTALFDFCDVDTVIIECEVTANEI